MGFLDSWFRLVGGRGLRWSWRISWTGHKEPAREPEKKSNPTRRPGYRPAI